MAKDARQVQQLTPKQMRVMGSPLRIEIVGTFQNYGSLSIRELAAKLERPADGLYHHVRQLTANKILRAESTRKVGRREEIVYALTAPRFGYESAVKSPAMQQAMLTSANAVLRLAAREFRHAVLAEGLAAEKTRGSSFPKRGKLSRQKSWLTEDDLRKLHEMLNEIDTFLRVRLKERKGKPMVLTTVMAPVALRKRSRE